jgi:hypothetical protein
LRFQLIKRRKSLLVTYFYAVLHYMATVEVHYNIQEMNFQLLTHAGDRWTSANVGDAHKGLSPSPVTSTA